MQNILIMGAGISGLGAARVLSDQGCHVVLSDLHEIQDEKKRSTLESRGVRFSIGPQTTGLLDGIDTMVVSPVIPGRICWFRRHLAGIFRLSVRLSWLIEWQKLAFLP